MKHLLKEHGILQSFNIRQVITAKEFVELYESIASTAKSEKEIKSKFATAMGERSIQNIPGTIPPNQAQLRMQELYERSILISNFIQKDSLSKKELIVLINFIAKNLGVYVESEPEEET